MQEKSKDTLWAKDGGLWSPHVEWSLMSNSSGSLIKRLHSSQWSLREKPINILETVLISEASMCSIEFYTSTES